MIPCDTDMATLLGAAWSAANLHANALDRNSQHTVSGLTAQLAMGVLTDAQKARVLAYWSWWKAVWDEYARVITLIKAGEVVTYDPAVCGPCPFTIWQLSSEA